VPAKSSFPFDIFSFDHNDRTPASRQVYNAIRSAILRGILRGGSRLPSTRGLSKSLGVARNGVVAAYDQLLMEGYLQSRSGIGTFVAPAIRASANAPGTRGGPEPTLSRRASAITGQPRFHRNANKLNLHPGYPETETFPFAVWSKLLARRALSRSDELLTYTSFAGHPALRSAIANYVAVMRGIACSPEQVVVTTGAQAALDILARMLLDSGDVAWLEEPGYVGARSVLLASGARLVPLRVTDQGWAMFDPALARPGLIYVTPSCQWPTGRTMWAGERLELLELANRQNAWIIEDDYDGEYRFRGRATSALQGMDASGRVIYVGTFGKTLFSSLRIGFMIVPVDVVAAVERMVEVTGQFAPLLLQATLADFIEKGHFAAHLKKMRALYAQRQREFMDLCREHLAEWMTVSASDSGIQCLGRFAKPFDDREVARVAFGHGVDTQPISQFYSHDEPQHGLLLGYGRLNQRDSQSGVSMLKRTFQELDAAGRTSGS
jgi:GntR family transcriptional regulator/MocR family aminotransferase